MHHNIIGDAAKAAAELNVLPDHRNSLADTSAFALKLEYEFDPFMFHGRFWLAVGVELGLTRKRKRKEGCGKGHILFFSMRHRYRRMRDFADSMRRSEIPKDELEARREEAQRFCLAITKVPVEDPAVH